MPSASRTTVLKTIRQGLAQARFLPPGDPAPGMDISLPPVPDRVQRFSHELQALAGHCRVIARAEAAAVVLELVRARQAQAALIWQAPDLPVPGLAAALQDAGITVESGQLPTDPAARATRLAAVEQVRIGITGVDAALADTGTLAVRSGPGRPRLASLSVRTHIALLTPDQVYASWAEWWQQQPALADWIQAGSNLTLISGPSRTADIEMTLTVGVHGPGEVIALICVP